MFDQAFIEATREAQGDEAANQLIAANMSEEHRGRMQRVATDQTLAAKYPRVLKGVKDNVLQIPTLPSDEAMEQYLAQQEKVLTDLGVPDPTKAVVAPVTPTTPDGMDPNLFGKRPGLIPWSEDATQAMSLQPVTPGAQPGQAHQLVSDIEETMDPDDGKFRRDRDRTFEMIKGMEAANSVIGGTQEIRAMREGFEDPDFFTI